MTTNPVDVAVKALFDKVQAKKLAIQNAEKPNWQTSGSFGYNAHSAHDRINIQTVTDPRKLIEVLAFLKDRAKNYVEAATELSLDADFKWLSFTVDEWKSDLQTRANQLSIQAKKKELTELENRLNALISPELKAQMELAEISKALEG